MGRSRRKKSSRARRFAWCLVLGLLGWGAWQSMHVVAAIWRDARPLISERSDLVDAQPSIRSATPLATAPAITASPLPNTILAMHAPDPDDLPDDPPDPIPLATAPKGSATAPAQVLPEAEREPTVDELAERGQRIDLLIEAADDAASIGNTLLQRQKLNEALALIGESARGPEVRQTLAAINTGVFLGVDVFMQDPYALLVSIEPNDSYQRIARRYCITSDLLAMLNPQLSPRQLRPGTGIKVVHGPFHARVVKHDLRLDLYARDMYVRSFPIQLEDGNYLPTGTYRVVPQGRIRLEARDAAPCREWVGLAGIEPSNRQVSNAWLYGTSGPRGGNSGLSGVRLDDSDLHTLYNVLAERLSLVRVDP